MTKQIPSAIVTVYQMKSYISEDERQEVDADEVEYDASARVDCDRVRRPLCGEQVGRDDNGRRGENIVQAVFRKRAADDRDRRLLRAEEQAERSADKEGQQEYRDTADEGNNPSASEIISETFVILRAVARAVKRLETARETPDQGREQRARVSDH